jgi:hypothetical protein
MNVDRGNQCNREWTRINTEGTRIAAKERIERKKGPGRRDRKVPHRM